MRPAYVSAVPSEGRVLVIVIVNVQCKVSLGQSRI